MQMEEGLDTGPMLLIEALPITEADTTGTLHDKLAALGGKMIVEAVQKLEQGQLPATPQPDEGTNYAAKISKDEAALDFTLPAAVLARKIRAFNPFPGATAQHGESLIKFWQAQALPGNPQTEPGRVLQADAQGVQIACGEGVLQVTELQKPGGKRLPAGEFLKGMALAGETLR